MSAVHPVRSCSTICVGIKDRSESNLGAVSSSLPSEDRSAPVISTFSKTEKSYSSIDVLLSVSEVTVVIMVFSAAVFSVPENTMLIEVSSKGYSLRERPVPDVNTKLQGGQGSVRQ